MTGPLKCNQLVQFLLSSNIIEEIQHDFEALEYNIIFYHPLPVNHYCHSYNIPVFYLLAVYLTLRFPPVLFFWTYPQIPSECVVPWKSLPASETPSSAPR